MARSTGKHDLRRLWPQEYPSKIERAATPENHLTFCGDCHYAMYAHFLNGEYIGHPNEPTARIIDGR